MSSRCLRNDRAIFFMGSMRERMVWRHHSSRNFAAPGWRVVFPKLLKGFLEKVGADGFQVVAEHVAQPESLIAGKVVFAFEQEPAGFLQYRLITIAIHASRFSGADIVESIVHFRDDMEAVEDVEGLRAFLTNDLQIWLPHVRADKQDFRRQFVSDQGEESLKRFDGSFLADPEQTSHPEIDLINQRQVLVAPCILDFIHADGVDGTQCPMSQPEGDDVLYGVVDLVP